jgi:Holliday junction resolvasome RuvABC endonuclease subunit
MNLLAIDPGIHLGWASFANGHVESGVHDFALGRGDSPGMRFLRFRQWLADMLTMTKPGLVIYERPHMRGGFATDLLVGFSTRIQEACAERGIEFEAVHSATLKKSACGSGRAQKAEMILVARERFAKAVTSDDEADALNLLWLAMKENR